MNTTICEKCGETIRISDFPFCPHGRAALGVQGDDWPGGKVFEHLGDQPITLYSRTELRRELKARGLQEFVRHTEGSRITKPWTAVDLEAGKALAARQAHTKAPADDYRPNRETIAVIKQVYEEFRAGRLPPGDRRHDTP